MLLSTLFGAGYVGLRALATGLPVSFLLHPRRALAEASACTTPQYIILATSGNGDPINANVPGTYLDPKIVHSADPAMAPTDLMLGGQTWQAAAPWASLPRAVLDRTCFWHLMTNTPVHPKEPDVLKLMGSTKSGEMLPSLLARQLAPCLGTIQTQPITVGATSPSEGLTFAGAALPIVPPLSLKATLTSAAPGTALGALTRLQPLRDQTLSRLNALYKNGASASQRAFVDAMASSQQQVRSIKQELLDALGSINDNGIGSQITAAIALIKMNVTPVVAIHIPFGGDNHNDAMLQTETAQTISGVNAISSLLSQLAAAGLSDRVTFVSLNVFGRTLSPTAPSGRQHNPNHQVSITIGAPYRSGVIGGVAPVDKDFGAVSFDSASGLPTVGGDISPIDSLASFGKTVLTAAGVDATTVSSAIQSGRVVTAALK